MDLSSEKLIYNDDFSFSGSAIEQIKTSLASLRDQIKEQFRLTDLNCGLSEKKENGRTEYYLEAWPHGIKVILIPNTGSMEIWFVNQCEGVSHDGMREALNLWTFKLPTYLSQFREWRN